MTTRRDFLLSGLGASAALPMLGVRPAPAWLQGMNAASVLPRRLVIVEVRGGWDYFNQIVPVNEPVYYAARPTSGIGIADADNVSTLRIAASVPQKWAIAAQPFKNLYDRGDLAILHNVGNPQADLSHDVSQQQWYTADPARAPGQNGWLARYLETGYSGGAPVPAVCLEAALNPSFAGSGTPVLRDLANFGFQFDLGTHADNRLQEQLVKELAVMLRAPAQPSLRIVAEGISAANDASRILRDPNSYTPSVQYPQVALAQDLLTVARYINGGLPISVFYASTTGFDTHANQAVGGSGHTGTYATLLRDTMGSVFAFLEDMRLKGVGQDVVVLLFSEFGRRFGMNGSLGTDHGHGCVAYLAGQPVNGGIYGTFPNLSQATQPYYNWHPPFGATSLDYRSVYATILERWLGAASVPVLGQQFPLLGAL